MKTVGILVFDGVEELDFAGPLQVFGMASRTVEVKVVTVAESESAIRCHYGLRVSPDFSFARCPALDLLVVPGGPGARTHARVNAAILEFIQKQRGFVASVCTGALVLAAAGILTGEDATTHHNRLDILREYPGVAIKENVRMVIGDRVATSAGVSAGIDLSLALVSKFWGVKAAEQIAQGMEWESRSWRN